MAASPAPPGDPAKPGPDLRHVESWVFDLDNTLYPATCDLFAGVDVRIREFVARALCLPLEEAHLVQKRLYAEHGTTLNGLMKLHGQDPKPFLDYIHEIDLSPLDGAPDLSAALSALPGKLYVFTNGSRDHAERVTRRMKIDHLFHDVFDITDSDYTPKHEPRAFDRFLSRTGVDPGRAAMFEDLARNLEPAHDKGFTTILVRSTKDWSREPAAGRPAGPGDHPPHAHYVTDNLPEFLGTLRLKGPAHP